MKAQFMKAKQIPFLAENCKAIKNVPIGMLQDDETSSCIAKCKRKVINENGFVEILWCTKENEN
jgi:predicted class III extradiol MEMO1 family dioxygenase